MKRWIHTDVVRCNDDYSIDLVLKRRAKPQLIKKLVSKMPQPAVVVDPKPKAVVAPTEEAPKKEAKAIENQTKRQASASSGRSDKKKKKKKAAEKEEDVGKK